MLLIKFFILIVLCEAITEIFTKRSIFDKLREFWREKSDFLYQLFTCGACFSVWVGVFLAYLFDFRLGLLESGFLFYLEPFFLGLVIHRLATLWHNFIGIFKYGLTFNSNSNSVQTVQNINSEIEEVE